MSRKFDYLGDVEVFITVVEHGSFTAAAVALSTTPSVLSRAVSRLEVRLGRQLLQRTTRRVGLTEAGRIYLEQARSAFSCLMTPNAMAGGRRGSDWPGTDQRPDHLWALLSAALAGPLFPTVSARSGGAEHYQSQCRPDR